MQRKRQSRNVHGQEQEGETDIIRREFLPCAEAQAHALRTTTRVQRYVCRFRAVSDAVCGIHFRVELAAQKRTSRRTQRRACQHEIAADGGIVGFHRHAERRHQRLEAKMYLRAVTDLLSGVHIGFLHVRNEVRDGTRTLGDRAGGGRHRGGDLPCNQGAPGTLLDDRCPRRIHADEGMGDIVLAPIQAAARRIDARVSLGYVFHRIVRHGVPF